MKLSDFFATVAPFLEGRATHAEAVKALYGDRSGPEKSAERWAIYGRFAQTHRFEVLDSIYPHLRRTVTSRGGKAAWSGLVAAYFEKHPMRHFELNANGAHLSEFLKGYAEAAGLPAWTPELADFEWWEWLTIIAPNEPEGAIGLRISPTVELRPYAYDFVGWLDAEEAERPEAPEAEESLVLFWRTPAPDFELRRENASPLELRVLKAVSEGLALGDAAAAAGVSRDDLEETFRDLADAGILLGAD